MWMAFSAAPYLRGSQDFPYDADTNAARMFLRQYGMKMTVIERCGHDENVEVGKKVGYIDKTGEYVWAPTK